QHLREVQVWLQDHPGDPGDHETVAHRTLLFDQIDRYLYRPYRPDEHYGEVTVPPGSPIGEAVPSFVQRRRARQAYLERTRTDEVCAFRP
ncbi:MAG: hypothetical protein D6746_04620, partial [Bacteroidetes bacterium]